MLDTITIILTIIYGIIGWILYHKILNIYYFDLFNGLFREFIGAALFGFAMATLTIKFWWVAIIIAIIIGVIYSIAQKKDNE